MADRSAWNASENRAPAPVAAVVPSALSGSTSCPSWTSRTVS
jgi:hypothetical protein